MAPLIVVTIGAGIFTYGLRALMVFQRGPRDGRGRVGQCTPTGATPREEEKEVSHLLRRSLHPFLKHLCV